MVNIWEKIKCFVSDLVMSFIDFISDIAYFFSRTLYLWISLLELLCPYLMWYITIYCYKERGSFQIGGEVFIPIVYLMFTRILKNFANRRNLGNSIPVPRERFTKELEEGEFSVDENRLQEMILYVADVEDYLERKGLIK